MKVNSQNHDATAFGHRIRIAKRLVTLPNGHTMEEHFAMRGNKRLGFENTGCDGKMRVPFNDLEERLGTYIITADKYFASPVKDFFNGVARKITNPELRKRYNAINKASSKTAEA